QRAVDGPVLGDFVLDIGTVIVSAFELAQFRQLGGGGLGQRLAGRVVLRCHIQLLDQRQGLNVHSLVVPLHFGGKGLHVGIGGLDHGLVCGGDVKNARSVGDVRNLRIIGGLGQGDA